MSEDLFAAIIGCGRMGRQRAKNLRSLGVRVAVFVDEVSGRAEALASDFPGAAVALSLDEVSKTKLDALFVCTPPGARRGPVLAAVRAGAALFLEKPIATTLEEARWMRDTAVGAGLVTAVGYMNRYRSGVLRARELARSTEVLGLRCHWTCGPYNVPWWGERRLSGGPVNEQATHLVDLCRFVCGEIVDVCTNVVRDGETAAALFTFRSGALGTLFYSCGAPEKGIGLELFTRRGTLRLEGWEFRLTQDVVDVATCGDEDPFAVEVEAFIRAVASGDLSAVRCDLVDAFETQQVVELLRTSTPSGREVKLASV